MKKTISITLNGLVFNIEEDAYNRLNSYLESLKGHFDKQFYGSEVVNDIEARIAEQFSIKISDRKKVAININEVEGVIKTIGTVEDLSGLESNTQNKQTNSKTPDTKRFYRNPQDQIIGGVAAGLASYFNIDPVIFRIIFVVLALAWGWGILLYILLWVIVPEAKTNIEKLEMKGDAVTVANLEESAKQSNEKNFSVITKLIKEIFSLLTRFIKAVIPIFLAFFGIIITIAAFFMAFALTVTAATILFNPNSPYIDPLAREVLNNSTYWLGATSGYIALFIPALLAMLIGISLIRRKSSITKGFVIPFVIVWVVAVSTFAALAVRAAPQIESAIQTIEKQKETRTYNVVNFNKVKVDHSENVKILRGNNFSVTAEGTSVDLDRVSFDVTSEGALNVDTDGQGFNICLICIHRTVTVTVTMPSLTSLDIAHAGHASLTGFTDDQLEINARNAAVVEGRINTKNLKLDINNAARIELSGIASRVDANLSNASQFFGEDLLIEDLDIKALNASRAHVNVSKHIEGQALNSSQIIYSGTATTNIKTLNAAKVNKVQ